MPKRPRPAPRLFAQSLSTLVGSTIIGRLTATDDDHCALRIGRGPKAQRWSIHQLAVELGVTNIRAARLLTAAADSIDAKNVGDLFRRSTPYTFALHGIGDTTMYVLWRLFESQGLDPERWATAGDTDAALVSFHSMKKREADAEARAVAADKKRARQSRRATHEAGVRRLESAHP
jgi:hypothetical protein